MGWCDGADSEDGDCDSDGDDGTNGNDGDGTDGDDGNNDRSDESTGGVHPLDKKLDLLRLNSMRKYVANMKHYICAHIYVDVNIQYIYANICNIFTAYVKVTTYMFTTYLRRE